MSFTRKIDRFYDRHPRTALAIAIVIAFVCMALVDQLSHSDNAAIRIQVASRAAT